MSLLHPRHHHAAVDVKVTLDACPTCGGTWRARVNLVYTTEIPGLPLPPVVS